MNVPFPGLVDLRHVLASARFDVAYHSADNVTGKPLPGYAAPGAWLQAEAAAALRRAEMTLAERGLGLLVHDAYRPVRATDALVAWARRTGRPELVTGGYISPVSDHNKGAAIDVGLFDLRLGAPLDMGSAFDDLSPASHTANADGLAATRRAQLVEAMGLHGLVNYHREWWHFTWPAGTSRPRRDVPYGRDEPPEGAWTAPPGWETPGWNHGAI